MADKLGLANEIKEIKLGKSFMNGEHPRFHTFRYDFMPASLDTSKRAIVDIGEKHQVTVTVPHIEGSGTANTVFKGSKKPYQKECVLIIDHTTGEITLEKLSYNVQLKKTRQEGSSKIRSSNPIENGGSTGKKSPPSHKLSPQRKPPGRSSPVQKCSPLPRSPLNSQTSPSGSTSAISMPCLTLTPPKQSTAITTALLNEDPGDQASEVGVLSSSSSSESSSSEESSDSSSSDNEEMPEPNPTNPPNLGNLTNGFMKSPGRKKENAPTSSNAPSMPVPTTSNILSMPVPTTSNILSMPVTTASNKLSMPVPTTSNMLSMPSVNSLPSMPKFSQLSEDLKLSESDSDSDA